MPAPPSTPDAEAELRRIVPARAVLTELARGFLLVRENDRERAVRFAQTFLREQADPARRPVPAAVPSPSAGQRSLGRGSRGAIERLDPRFPR